MQRLEDPVLQPLASAFDELRATRHESVYEPDKDESEILARLHEALDVLRQAMPAIRARLIETRRTLAHVLVDVPA